MISASRSELPEEPRPRVVHLIKGLGRGGAERLLPLLLRHSAGRYDFRVGYFLPHKNALAGEIESSGTPVTCLGGSTVLGMLGRIPRLARWLRRERIGLLHCHLPQAGIAGRLAGRLARVPVVYTEHNLQERYHPMTRRLNRATWPLQRQVVAVSGEVLGSIRRNIPGRVPARVVLNGIDVGAFAPRPDLALQARAQAEIEPDAPVIGTVAVLRSQKRLDHWLEVAGRVSSAEPSARFIVVGHGPLREVLEHRAADSGLTDRVRFVGLQADVLPWLAAMDVFLMTSEFEGLPLALLEAMAAERAVVATAVGGIPEVLSDAVHGKLAPFGDLEVLAAETVSLLRDPGRRTELGQAARRRVESEFSIARMARELEAIYAGVLSAAGD